MTDTPSNDGKQGEAEPVLTPTEHRLWNVLRGAPKRVFSRAELVSLVMPGTIVLERTIDVHIKSLRKKLGAAAGAIRTVRNAGYCFNEPA